MPEVHDLMTRLENLSAELGVAAKTYGTDH
jgi:hypothetical protein